MELIVFGILIILAALILRKGVPITVTTILKQPEEAAPELVPVPEPDKDKDKDKGKELRQPSLDELVGELNEIMNGGFDNGEES